MKGLLWLLAAFALAAGLSVAMRQTEGYVLFVLSPYEVEVSLVLFLLCVVVGLAVTYVLVRLVAHTLNLPAHVRAFRARQREKRGRAALLGALRSLFEGRFGRAEKLAAEGAELEGAGAAGSLIAARAAQRMRDFARRDSWLARARDAEPEWRHARLATEAELLLEERRFEVARLLLRELHAAGPRHIATLSMMLRAEQGLGNWEEVIRLARMLDKAHALPPEALRSIVTNAWGAMLARKAANEPGRLAEFWRGMPQEERCNARVAVAAARAFIQAGDVRGAQRIIEEALAQEWRAELVLLYGECPDGESLERIQRAEKWLAERPQDPELLLTLGRLCARRELWGKAQSYFEASLALQRSRAAHVALAQLLDHLGRAEEANRHYRAAAEADVAA
ncbi:MAG: hypothetical protein A3I00_03920 [Betaproteobacteria bacterium RIFCSPLOWO2_02_FULL_64_12]|nr:MAG: hypothetical protein A3I00_03920 [Betaproteobacteria bacterium RIFCSPLOWO2_02_FULL_64_12]